MEYEGGSGQSDITRKKLPSKSSVLLGLVYLPGVLLNCKPISGKPRASEVRAYHIAISQRVVTCKPTCCKFTTLQVSTCGQREWELQTCKLTIFKVAKCSM